MTLHSTFLRRRCPTRLSLWLLRDRNLRGALVEEHQLQQNFGNDNDSDVNHENNDNDDDD
jgi:hypothetical protein